MVTSSAQPAPAVAAGDRKPIFPFLDLRAQFASISDEILEAAKNVLVGQQLILGPEVAAFENEIAKYLDCRFAIGCASGSDALLLALMAVGIKPGDEVITTPFTFVATAGSIARLGAKPVFVDIDPDTFNIDPAQVERTIGPNTRAIIPAHLFGQSADMQRIMVLANACHIAVIEDAAQAIAATHRGTRVGSFGSAGCFSFFPSKNLGGAGDGGLITTNDPAIADRMKVLRVHGSRSKYSYEALGINSRLDALQAAILRVKLRHLDDWTVGRRNNAAAYRELFKARGLAQIEVPTEPDDSFHVYNQFVVRAANRDQLREHLRKAGIPTEVYYPSPLHLQQAFSYLGYKEGDFPEAESASMQVLALPIFPELTPQQRTMIVDAIADFYHNDH